MPERLFQPSSRDIAKLHEAFAHEGTPDDLTPSPAHLATILEEAFWASLRREEGRPIILSLAYLAPSYARHPFMLERAIPLEAGQLAKLAPAVERQGIHLGVAPDADGDLAVWGHTRWIPHACFVFEGAGPGVIVVKHRRAGSRTKFANIALITGNEVRFVRRANGSALSCLDLFEELLGRRGVPAPGRPNSLLAAAGPAEGGPWRGAADLLVRLAVSMRAHGRGGTILVVPDGDDAWTGSISRPIKYTAGPRYGELRELHAMYARHGTRRKYREARARAVDAAAGLTAVDGATVISDALDIVGFGAKIRRRERGGSVEGVTVVEPFERSEPEYVPLWALGGTRHQSGAQFVCDQLGVLALVSSQDGTFTAFARGEDGGVSAYRVEALLL